MFGAGKATAETLEETKMINKSLHTLGHVIYRLTSTEPNGREHIPYRNSVLTFMLRDALVGS